MIDSPCYCTNARARAARSLTDIYDRALEPVGVRVTQFSVLKALLRLDHPTITVLAEETVLDRSTLGRNLRIMVRNGWVEIGPGHDERSRVVTTTALGRDLVARAMPLWRAAQDEIGSVIGDGDRPVLLGAWARLAVQARQAFAEAQGETR